MISRDYEFMAVYPSFCDGRGRRRHRDAVRCSQRDEFCEPHRPCDLQFGRRRPPGLESSIARETDESYQTRNPLH